MAQLSGTSHASGKMTLCYAVLLLSPSLLNCGGAQGVPPDGNGGTSAGGAGTIPTAGGARNTTGGASPATGGAMTATGGTTSAAAGGAMTATGGTTNAAGGATAAIGGSMTTTGGTTNAAGGATEGSTCDAYKSATADPQWLLQACRLATNDRCPPTLPEYMTSSLRGAVTNAVKLVEGCGTRSVGWDAGLGGSVLTYDSNNQLIGFYSWDDVPNGPCKNVNSEHVYRMGNYRTTLRIGSTSCVSDVVCAVAAPTDESTLHCPGL